MTPHSPNMVARVPRMHAYHAMGTQGQLDHVFAVVTRPRQFEDVLDLAKSLGECWHVSSD